MTDIWEIAEQAHHALDTLKKQEEEITRCRNQLMSALNALNAADHYRRDNIQGRWNNRKTARKLKDAAVKFKRLRLGKSPIRVCPGSDISKSTLAALRLAAQPLEKDFFGPGIYFLFRAEELVYVGQSVKIADRIGKHLKQRIKDFDSICFLPCPESQLDETERGFIQAFLPRYNRDRETMSLKQIAERGLPRSDMISYSSGVGT